MRVENQHERIESPIEFDEHRLEIQCGFTVDSGCLAICVPIVSFSERFLLVSGLSMCGHPAKKLPPKKKGPSHYHQNDLFAVMPSVCVRVCP